MELGPIFNYARSASHLYIAQIIVDAFEALNTRLEAKILVHNKAEGWIDDISTNGSRT